MDLADPSLFRSLADMNRSGTLLFPEFALAMYLCNASLNKREVPDVLSEKIRNEVSSMADIISFGIPDSSEPVPPRPPPKDFSPAPNAPNFEAQNTTGVSVQPISQTNTSNLNNLSQLQVPTFTSNSNFLPSSPGLDPRAAINRQRNPSMIDPLHRASMIGSIGGAASPFNTTPQPSPLMSQPTGRPGQWGFVNTPAGGLPGIDALSSQLMPQSGRESGMFSISALKGNATIPWAVTKEEKKIYDGIFDAWDGLGRGSITGQTAIEIFRTEWAP